MGPRILHAFEAIRAKSEGESLPDFFSGHIHESRRRYGDKWGENSHKVKFFLIRVQVSLVKRYGALTAVRSFL